MWVTESENRKQQRTADVKAKDKLYRGWLNNKKKGRLASEAVGKRLKQELKEARTVEANRSQRAGEEGCTKEFHDRYKAPHAVTWIETLKKTKDWDAPEAGAGRSERTEGTKELRQEATKYYTWLFGEKKTERKAMRKFLAELKKDSLTEKDRDNLKQAVYENITEPSHQAGVAK